MNDMLVKLMAEWLSFWIYMGTLNSHSVCIGKLHKAIRLQKKSDQVICVWCTITCTCSRAVQYVRGSTQ